MSHRPPLVASPLTVMITAFSRPAPLDTTPVGGNVRALNPAEPLLTPDSPMIALAYRCLRREYRALRERQPERGTPATPEDVHRGRIATRRLRVALRFFASLLPPHAVARLGKELRWLAGALGSVRDLDVHTEAFQEHLTSAGTAAARDLGGYELALRRERLAARETLKDLFVGNRYTDLMSDLAALLDGAPSPAALRRWRSFTVREGAARYLKRSRKHVVKLGRKLSHDATPDDLHRLRIRAKRLRYALEFFVEPYPELVPAAKATKALQDVLGEHQDARTARRKILAYAREFRKRPDTSPPPQALAEWRLAQHRQAAQARRELTPAWQRFLAAIDLPDFTAR
ncbi:MAG: CHAD domain-containing protein [Gammaproteobacteria bacterium]